VKLSKAELSGIDVTLSKLDSGAELDSGIEELSVDETTKLVSGIETELSRFDSIIDELSGIEVAFSALEIISAELADDTITSDELAKSDTWVVLTIDSDDSGIDISELLPNAEELTGNVSAETVGLGEGLGDGGGGSKSNTIKYVSSSVIVVLSTKIDRVDDVTVDPISGTIS